METKTPKNSDSKIGTLEKIFQNIPKDNPFSRKTLRGYGGLAGLKGDFEVINIHTDKLMSLNELKDYLEKNNIEYDLLQDGNPSPCVGFATGLNTPYQTFYNFYCPRQHS